MPAKGAVGGRQQSPTFVVPQGLQVHARRGRDLPGAKSAGRLDSWHHLGHSSTVNPYPGTDCNPGGRIPVNDTRTFTGSDDLQGAEFVDTNLRGARFVRADLSGVVMREVDVQGADIDAPWLSDGESFMRVNGVDVIPFVEAELNRRFPGRADRRAEDPDALRAAWATLERTWAVTLERVAAMPAGTVDISIGGEWSFAQTLRHLVLATDAWLGRAILQIEQPFHAIGQAGPQAEGDGLDMSIFTTVQPSYAEVLEVRAGRVAMVRDFLDTVTPDELAAARKNPWAPEYPETTLSCLHVILEEEWEHHRYAVRDLDAIEAAPTG